MPRINETIRLNPYQSRPIEGQLGLDGMLAASQANNTALALSIAERTDADNLRPDEFAEFMIQRLRLLQRDKQHTAVIEQTSESSFRNRRQLFGDEQNYQLTAIEATSHEQLEHYLQAAKLRYRLSEAPGGRQPKRFSRSAKSLLADPLSPRYQREQLWQNLLQLSYSQLNKAREQEKQTGLRAWFELASLVRNPALEVDEQAQEFQRWNDRWSRSALSSGVTPPRELELLPQLAREKPREIAVLVPLSGKLASAGGAIQDGMIAAGIESRSNYRLRFYDTTSADIGSLISLANTNGADVVVGPLQKNKVRELINSHSSLPVLTLNYLPDGTAPPLNVTQFGLAGEDEASQLASLAEQANLSKVLVLHTGKDWAIRAAERFDREWSGRRYKTLKRELSTERNYNQEIAAALNVDQSKLRKDRLQALMGENFEFQTRRRSDIDAIVVFANGKQLSAIKPLLAYHYAGKLPVLTGSKINSARSKTELRDVNGVIFNDAPFLITGTKLSQRTRTHFKGNTQLTRLFAMGMDAYFLAPRLQLLQSIEQGPIPGQSGTLRLVNHRIERELDNAVIAGSRVSPISNEKIMKRLSRK